jgi:hypothetical protein
MSGPSYETDFVDWTEAQADRLRRLARGERVNDVDWDNLIEEVEALGRTELRAVVSLMERALEHGMKIIGYPGNPAERHWRHETQLFLGQARRFYEPSMARRIDVAAAYQDVLEPMRDNPPYGPLAGDIADAPSFTVSEFMRKDLTVDELLAWLRAQPTNPA